MPQKSKGADTTTSSSGRWGLACSATVVLAMATLSGVVLSSHFFSTLEQDFSKPKFVHIPRTGGTTIEDLCWKAHAAVGYCGAMHAGGLSYDVTSQYYQQCPPWHIPPSAFTPGSFAIKRNPYTKLASSFARWGVGLEFLLRIYIFPSPQLPLSPPTVGYASRPAPSLAACFNKGALSPPNA